MGLAAKKAECRTCGMSDHQTCSKANPLVGLTNEAYVVHTPISLICHNDGYIYNFKNTCYSWGSWRGRSKVIASWVRCYIVSKQVILLPTTGVVVGSCQNHQIVSSTHMPLGTVLPRRRRSTEPRRRGKRHTRWESGRTEARRWTWHSWWRECHRGSRKGRWTRCRSQGGCK